MERAAGFWHLKVFIGGLSATTTYWALTVCNVPDGGDSEINKTVSIPAHTGFTSWGVCGNEPRTYTKTAQYLSSFQTPPRASLKWGNLTQSQQRWHLRCDLCVKKGNSWWGRSWQISQERKVQRQVLKCTSKRFVDTLIFPHPPVCEMLSYIEI